MDRRSRPSFSGPAGNIKKTKKFPLIFLTVAVIVESLSNNQEVCNGGEVLHHAVPIPKDLGSANQSGGESGAIPSGVSQSEGGKCAIL